MANSLPVISTEITSVYTVTIDSDEGSMVSRGTTRRTEGTAYAWMLRDCGRVPQETES
jgi:hypothetical protein